MCDLYLYAVYTEIYIGVFWKFIFPLESKLPGPFALERSKSDFPTKKNMTPESNINFEKILPGGFI